MITQSMSYFLVEAVPFIIISSVDLRPTLVDTVNVLGVCGVCVGWEAIKILYRTQGSPGQKKVLFFYLAGNSKTIPPLDLFFLVPKDCFQRELSNSLFS